MRPEEPEPGPLRASGATTQTTGWVSPAEGRAARGPPAAGRACASFIEVSQTSDNLKQLQPLRLQPPLFESGRDSDTPVQLCTASHTQASTMPCDHGCASGRELRAETAGPFQVVLLKRFKLRRSTRGEPECIMVRLRDLSRTLSHALQVELGDSDIMTYTVTSVSVTVY